MEDYESIEKKLRETQEKVAQQVDLYRECDKNCRIEINKCRKQLQELRQRQLSSLGQTKPWYSFK
jgi:hypothetical protein